MAFFSAVSSSIGKRLLLFGLRHIDILDKDPTDFVSVDVGKRTTLEVRDVGLHIKKLINLLHVTLPPEIHLSTARASLLRATFVLDFGVPQILIEVEGVHVHGRLTEDVDSAPRNSAPRQSSPKPPRQPRHFSPPRDDNDSDTSDDAEEHVPTVDELAKSFVREEPDEEIRELEQELYSKSEYLQESLSSSEDGEDESISGMGAPLALPVYLRNILNTALDRLQIVVNDISIEIEDQFPSETANSSKCRDDALVSLNFHVERIAIDSLTTPDPRIDMTSGSHREDTTSNVGKRRMRVEKICARLISDAENFASMSHVSGPSSPGDTRSEFSSSQKARSEPAASQSSSGSVQKNHSEASEQRAMSTEEVSTPRLEIYQNVSSFSTSSPKTHLSASAVTTDDDRFADAASDDGIDQSMSNASIAQPRESLPRDMSASSLLYSDEGLFDYALQNQLLDSRNEDAQVHLPSEQHSRTRTGYTSGFSDGTGSYASQKELTVSELPSASMLNRPLDDSIPDKSLSHSLLGEQLTSSTDELDVTPHTLSEQDSGSRRGSYSPSTSQARQGDLTESKLFTHDDAESMYMSALSAAPITSSHIPHVPGGWDSSSTSSQDDTRSDSSGPIPEEMVSGSILEPQAEADDGCETPRPRSPQSTFSSPHASSRPLPTRHAKPIANEGAPKEAKLFLSIDEATIWFPSGIDANDNEQEDQTILSAIDFQSPNIGEDSIFQEMPGSFSNYAYSTSRRKPSIEESGKRSEIKLPKSEKPTGQRKQSSSSVSVEVGSIVAQTDISTGRILFQMINRVLKSVAELSPPDKSPKQCNEPSDSRANINLHVRHLGLAWLERLVADPVVHGEFAYKGLELIPVEALLRINLSSINMTTRNHNKEARTKLQIGKCVLSSLDEDIISFQSSRSHSRRSASISNQLTNAIEVDYERSKDCRITVATLPVNVDFDIQKMDDALGSFGGFSGVLELGNSMTSTNTIGSLNTSPFQPKPRGVHFRDTPAITSSADSAATPKIHVQFGEVSVVLKGKVCAVQLQTTSVRLAIRESNLRLKVSEVKLSGPYISGSQAGPPLMGDIKGVTITLLFAPEEVDLTRLISLITPSKDPYENDEDILIDTFLRQRRKGSVIRAEIASVSMRISDLGQMQTLEALGAEVARLSRVTKYLPDDDRPGILTLATVQDLDAGIVINDRIGDVSVALKAASVAHVGVPALFAMEIGQAVISRSDEVLVHEMVKPGSSEKLPMVMVRIVGDEIEPVVKTKLFNVCAEYRVSTIMAALGLSEYEGTADDIALGIASSVATITGASSPKTLSRQTSESSSPLGATVKPMQIDLLLRNCAIGLNPRKIPSKGLFVLSESHVAGRRASEDYSMTVDLRRASIHAIDDIGHLQGEERGPSSSSPSATIGDHHLRDLHDAGYVSLSSISAAKVLVNITGEEKHQPQVVNIEFKNDLFVLESCADSTQTLIAILNGLQPPTPPSSSEHYRTVVPLQQMMESFTGDAMVAPERPEEDEFMETADLVTDEVPTNLEYVGSFYNPESLPTDEQLGDSMLGEDDLGTLASSPSVRQSGDRGLLESFQEQYEVAEGETDFDFSEGHFKSSDSDHKGKARKWDSTKNQYHLTNEFKVPNAPLKLCVRDMNIIWNLYDGYDWPRTRGVIAQAVEDVEARAEERRRAPSRDEEDDNDFVEQDFLFNSVWIGVPVKDEKGALARQINHDIDDLVSETGSYAMSTATRSTGATARPRSSHKPKRRRLKLERSKYRKIAFQMMNVAVDLIVYPPNSGETINSVNVRVQDLDIFDHVPSSTWKKFVTCLIEPNKREMLRPMVDLDVQTVKPVTELAASELVIKAAVLPLRLHVDQDALDFITRFFEFKDEEAAGSQSPSDQPFIQRLEVKSVVLKLDYKPKRVDYRGLRSGHTTEFMNFLILDGADIVLQHAIVYGITSFDKLHKTLNDIWMPDVKQNQLPGVLSGLAAVRPLVNVGSGVRDLVVVPMREYKRDGRIVRSVQKGVYAFAKNTTSEVARLGAKMAIGTQTLLEGAENFLNPHNASSGRSSGDIHDWDGEDPSSDSDEPRAVSNYAHQPIGVREGLRSAARHMERDLITARDAVIAIPSEVMEEGSGVGMARAFVRHAPTVIIRPALGATKVMSNALLGVGNALDEGSRRKIDDKYKSY